MRESKGLALRDLTRESKGHGAGVFVSGRHAVYVHDRQSIRVRCRFFESSDGFCAGVALQFPNARRMPLARQSRPRRSGSRSLPSTRDDPSPRSMERVKTEPAPKWGLRGWFAPPGRRFYLRSRLRYGEPRNGRGWPPRWGDESQNAKPSSPESNRLSCTASTARTRPGQRDLIPAIRFTRRYLAWTTSNRSALAAVRVLERLTDPCSDSRFSL